MPEPSELPEEHAKDLELMLAVRDGDETAFRALVERHQLPLVNFFARLGSGDAAEDLAQQTFLRLYKYRTRYEPRARFTTFLYMMARQIRIDSLRKLQRVKRLKEEFEEEQFLRAQEGSGEDSLFLQAEAALEELPEKMRLVVVMSLYQDLKYEEISDILEIPIGTVKSRMFQALRRLRDQMGIDGDG